MNNQSPKASVALQVGQTVFFEQDQLAYTKYAGIILKEFDVREQKSIYLAKDNRPGEFNHFDIDCFFCYLIDNGFIREAEFNFVTFEEDDHDAEDPDQVIGDVYHDVRTH